MERLWGQVLKVDGPAETSIQVATEKLLEYRFDIQSGRVSQSDIRRWIKVVKRYPYDQQAFPYNWKVLEGLTPKEEVFTADVQI